VRMKTARSIAKTRSRCCRAEGETPEDVGGRSDHPRGCSWTVLPSSHMVYAIVLTDDRMIVRRRERSDGTTLILRESSWSRVDLSISDFFVVTRHCRHLGANDSKTSRAFGMPRVQSLVPKRVIGILVCRSARACARQSTSRESGDQKDFSSTSFWNIVRYSRDSRAKDAHGFHHVKMSC